jgi:hypothetical protein
LRSTISSVVLSTCAFLAMGCESNVLSVMTASPDGPAFTGPAPTLTTDRAAYVAVGDSTTAYRQWRFTLIAALHNASDQTLYIGNCGSRAPSYELGSYTASSAYAPNYACSGGQFGFALLPHTIRIDTLQIIGPNTWDGRTGVGFGSLSGTLALSYALATCTDVELCHAGTIAAISAPFTVDATQ